MTQIPADLVVVGKITTVYGVKGWVKVHSFTDPMENILGYKECFLNRSGVWQPLEFAETKRHGKGLIAFIDGVENREQARLYCQSDIAIAATALPELPAEDYYWHQLEGLQVVTIDTATTEQGGEPVLLGKVHQVMETGANDVVIVRKCQGSLDANERLIPWLPDQVIKSVDLAAGVITVDWPADF